MNTRNKGKAAEYIAINFLEQKGLSLIQKNFFTRNGEIDLIMQAKDFIVFVEVKSLKVYSSFYIYETLSKRKKSRVKLTIEDWLNNNNKLDCLWRCDFLGVIFDKSKYSIEHFENIEL